MTLSLMEPGDVRTPTCSKRVSCYRLGLANGLAWHLVTTAQSEQWIARIAAVMQLKRGDAADLTDTFEGAGSVRGESALLAPAPGRRAKRMRHGALTIEQLADQGYLIHSVRPVRRGPLNIEQVWGSFFHFYVRLLDSGGLPIHAALVRRENRCVLLAAKGKTGKSTCCRRLPEPWQGICDEEAVAVPVAGSGYRAHPFPTWSDLIARGLRKSWEVERSVPLSALYFLEQGDEDSVTSVGPGEAAMQLCHRAREKCPLHEWGLTSHQERAVRLAIFDNARKMAWSLPAYRLTVRFDGRFWEELEGEPT